MKIRSKRLRELENVVKEKFYSITEGISLIKKIANAKFIESVEAHISLNIDPKYANQQLRASLLLPNGTGKKLRIAVLTEPDLVNEALEMGASMAGSEEFLEKMGKGELNFDLLITTPKLMPKLARLGRILGPKGLMPSPKAGTVTQNIKHTIEEFTKGRVDYRADKTGIVHLAFGKANFSEEQLLENFISIYNSIEKNKPIGVKGKYFKSLHICTTMSPSININYKK